jgi:heme/copper-type cytochrome/quinol oxidase subunit 4
VHPRYFLHLDLAPSVRPELFVLGFAAILTFPMIGGSLRTMFDLRAHMIIEAIAMNW